MRERLGALRNLPPFMRIVWETSRPLTIAQGVLRLGRALLPVVVLYIGKLIIDEVVDLAQRRGAGDYGRITGLDRARVRLRSSPTSCRAW
jgi:hypothetical protein